MKHSKAWHSLKVEQVEEILDTKGDKGLSEDGARALLAEYGPNVLEEVGAKSALAIFLSQFNNVMVWILIAAALISGALLREFVDATVIVGIIVMNAILGFVQEFRAERALQALKEMSSPTAYVVRDGQEMEVASRNLVPGDVLVLETGDRIPADGRVIQSINLKVDEASLTGESASVNKLVQEMAEDTTLPDRANMVYSGTTVVSGRGKAIIVATGNDTELGRIAEMIQAVEEETPLQRELKDVGKKIAIICLSVSAIVFGAGIWRGYEVALMFLAGVSLAVAAIPEGLPAVVTVSLALGVQRMARKNAIIRRLSAVESLGSASIICTDKTGTLTKNKMAVKELWLAGDEYANNPTGWEAAAQTASGIPDQIGNGRLKKLLEICLLCNDARYGGDGNLIGDPTEGALLDLGRSFGLEKKNLEDEKPRLGEITFDSARKMMTTLHRKERGSYIAMVKGAPEVVLSHSHFILDREAPRPLNEEEKASILEQNSRMAASALRTLAFAYREFETHPNLEKAEEVERELVFVGMVGMIDPPREEVYQAIDECQKAGIKVMMVTGDHRLTAEAIGKELGMLQEGGLVIDGREMDAMADDELAELVEEARIFARVSPEHKLKIVEYLQEKGHVVAMTGDGVNDAPSLKKADIGIAMGITGTDVSKEASDMVLADDNFATIVRAVREGRIIYDNLKKFIFFLLSCNASEVFIMLVAIVFGSLLYTLITGQTSELFLPLLPAQILWMNLVTDGLPALALGVDPVEKDVMRRPPQKRKEKILNRRRLLDIVWQGTILMTGSLFVFLAGPIIFGGRHPEAQRAATQTMVFSTLVFSQLFYSFNCRSETKGLFRRDIFSNLYLVIAVVVSILLQVALIYIPFLQEIFDTTALDLSHLLIMLAGSSVPVLLIDLAKRIRGRSRK